MPDLYTVTELAEQLGTTPRALRFYEDKGLVMPQRAGTTRIYTHRDRGRLALILRGKRLGFSLREIGEWLDIYDTDPAQSKQMQVLIEKVHARIIALERQRDDLDATLGELNAIEKSARYHLDITARSPGHKDATGGAPPQAEI